MDLTIGFPHVGVDDREVTTMFINDAEQCFCVSVPHDLHQVHLFRNENRIYSL